MPRRPAHRLLLAVAVALAACSRGDGPPPAAEFVLASGDSSWWVRTGPDAGPEGVSVRRAPLVLARLNGRFHELFVTEEDYSFPDAAFTSQTVWRRDLVTNDSIVVFGDPTVARLAIAYARANPGAFPLAPDERAEDDPSASAALEVAVVDVLGPWLVIETFADVHPARGPELHRARRGVVDLRTGRVQSLARLVGDSTARAAVARARLAFARARDSLRRTPRDSGAIPLAALDGIAFDERSFALRDGRRGPSVVFHVPVGDEGGHTLPLAPIALPDGAWWREARVPAPSVSDGRTTEWRRGDVAVRVRPRRRGAAHDVVLRAAGREWTVAHVALAVDRLHWIEAVPDEHRGALVRAFDAAQRYDGTYSAVADRRPRRAAADRPLALRPAARTTAPERAARHPARIPHSPR